MDRYPVLLQLAPCQGKRFLDKLVEVECTSFADVALEARANASDHLSRAMTVGDDSPECLLGSVEIGRGAIEKAQARIGSRHHRIQWLSHLVSDRRRDSVPGHQPDLTLAAL